MQLTFNAHVNSAINSQAECPHCGRKFDPADAHRANNGSWPVAGYPGLQKIYFDCPKCKQSTQLQEVSCHAVAR